MPTVSVDDQMTANIRFPYGQSFIMKPHVQKFADALEVHMGGALNFGTYQGHSPPEGPTQAVDIFNPNSASGWAQQDEICSWVMAGDWAIAKLYGLRYMIRRHHINNIERRDEGWRDQGVTGNQTVDHMDHTHITFYADAPINHGKPPAPTTTGDEGMKVRYIWGPDGLHRTDWVFDAPGKIFAQIGSVVVLKACDLNHVPELGLIGDADHEWFKAQAENWQS